VGGRRDGLTVATSVMDVDGLLGECRSLLYDISLQSNISDQWL
jgi:hypothetical protein